MDSLLLIDSFNIYYRSFYALKSLNNSNGISINAIFGFSKIFFKLIRELFPNKVIAFGDTEKSNRKQFYPEYKANRESVPNELKSQIKYLKKFFDSIEVPYLTEDYMEADDLINYVALSSKDKYSIIIVSSDKDLHYLTCNENIKIYDPFKNIIIDKKYLNENYCNNCTEEKIWLYYALIGDVSDNIPGVNGLGKKTAEKIISEYSSIEDFYNNFELNKNLTKKIKEKILSQKENAFLSYKLVKPDLSIKGKNNINEILQNLKEFNKLSMNKNLNGLFNELEFKSLIDNKENQDLNKDNKIHYVFNNFKVNLYTEENKKELIDEIKNSQIIAVDVETRGGNYKQTTMIGFSLCTKEDCAWYIPLYVNKDKVNTYNERIEIFSLIKNHLWILHKAIADIYVIKNTSKIAPNNVFDTMILAFILQEKKVGLKELSSNLFNERMMDFYGLIVSTKSKFFDDVPLKEAAEYASSDARQTFKLYFHLLNNLKKESLKLYDFVLNVEMPLINVLYKMEFFGIYCDKDILINISTGINTILLKINDKINNFISNDLNLDIDFNPLSSKKTILLLNEVLKSYNIKINSSDQKILLEIKDLSPIIGLIIEYREYYALSSKFLVSLLNSINLDDRIRTNFQQISTITGRLSTTDPNLQNIPTDTEYISIRSAFKAPINKCILSFDYSQIELRVLAHFSNDLVLCDAFNNDIDVHIKTAEGIFNKSKENISNEERKIAKRINFGIIYGLSAFGLSKDLGIKMSSAKQYIESYKTIYKDVFDWIEKIKEEAIQNGYVETYFERRRFIPELQDKNKNIFAYGCRQAVNTIIQGTAAEIIKKSMIEIDKYLENKKSKMVLQIHDEILIETDLNEAEEIIIHVKNIMVNIITLNIKLIVNFKNKSSW